MLVLASALGWLGWRVIDGAFAFDRHFEETGFGLESAN
jgi:hypothetical protein